MCFNYNDLIKVDNKDVAFIGSGWYNDETLNTQMSVIFAQMSSQSTGLDQILEIVVLFLQLNPIHFCFIFVHRTYHHLLCHTFYLVI